MFWVIQNNIYQEQKHNELIKILERFDIPHIQVKIVPIFDMLLPYDYDSFNHGELKEEDEVYIDNNQMIMTCGGLTLTRIAKQRNWKPGTFLNENFDYSKWSLMYGNNLLNNVSIVDTLQNIKPIWNEFFIRPCEDTKHFNGTVFSKDEFIEWKKYLGNSCPFIEKNVVASPTKKIYSEYRFFVVDKKIITYSQYKIGFKVITNDIIDDRIIDFAQQMINQWQPARAFVIDIADTPDGLKIVEINNFNSAGFYACNVGKIVEAIESMNFD